MCAVILWFFKKIVLSKLGLFAKRTKIEWDDYAIEIIENLNWPFYLFLSLFLSTRILTLPPFLAMIDGYLLLFVVTFYVAKSFQAVINVGARKIIKDRARVDKDDDPTAIQVLSGILRVIVWALAIVFILSNFGVNISALVAGLGIGGIAIAFALQNVLSDIFASFSIYFDKPFKKGDFIIVGQDMGVVKKVGLKTTRVQTLQGQELIISNQELTSTRINNYKRMDKRRIVFSFGVTYDTNRTKLKKIPKMVSDIMNGLKDVRVDRVHLQKFGDFSMIFEAVYFLDSPDYNRYMDVQEEIIFKIIDAFDKEKIEFAFPTQTVYVNHVR